MDCPICGKTAKTPRGLTKHLTGGKRYGGHELSQAAAVENVARASSGHEPDADPDLEHAPVIAASRELSNEQRSSFLYGVLTRLVGNKALPKYQFERAIDGFLGAFLPSILESKIGGRVQLIAQEFPLKKAEGFQSTNVDYVLLREGEAASWIFVELKTDPRSVREEQDAIYVKRLTRDTTMADLLDDVHAIMDASTQRSKYQDLLERFRSRPLQLGIELVYLSPVKHQLTASVPFRSITFEDLSDLDVEEFSAEWELFQTLVLPQLRSRS